MNRELIEIFEEMAKMLELEDVDWKPRAYREAARGIKNQEKDVKDIYDDSGKKGLEDIKGVGESMAEHIAEYIELGKIKKFEKLRKKYPKEITKLLDLEGLGPKRIKELLDEFDISDSDDLKKAAENHKIKDLEGFGEKIEKEILNSLKLKKKTGDRMLLDEALPIAEEIAEYLKENCDLKKIDYAGSLRRMKETIGDVDVLVVSDSPGDVVDAFVSMDNVKKVISKGNKRSSVVLKEKDVHVDLRVFDEKSYGAALVYFTGSKDHNIEIRKRANDKGYKLSEYGLKKKKKISCAEEKDVYDKIGLKFIKPEMRENTGEVEAAEKNKLPDLIEYNDLRGDLQMHSEYSDGINSVEEMAEKAEKIGYDYIAITDHSPSSRVAGGLEKKDLKKQWKDIENVGKKFKKLKILKGSEVDIKKDGSLDYDDSVLKNFDVVVISIHSNFNMSKKDMTERILRAMDNKYVNILAHPTARRIGKRKGIEFDREKIFEKAAEKNIALEINASPERLDLNDSLIRFAKEKGVKFVINTDAHSKNGLENIKFGIGQARRGWLEKKDVINTKTFKQLNKFLKK